MVHPRLKDILVEFPHTPVPEGHGSPDGYDGEWERYQNDPEGHHKLVTHMTAVFAGVRHEDKHGGHIHLKSRAAKLEYLDSLRRDRIAANLIASMRVPSFKALPDQNAKASAREAAFDSFATEMRKVIDHHSPT